MPTPLARCYRLAATHAVARTHKLVDAHVGTRSLRALLAADDLEQPIDLAFAQLRRCGARRLYDACTQARAFVKAPKDGAERLNGCGPSDKALQEAAQPSALWQSWYHLFLPGWLELGAHRIFVIFSEDVRPCARLRMISALIAATFLVADVLLRLHSCHKVAHQQLYLACITSLVCQTSLLITIKLPPWLAADYHLSRRVL